MATTSPDGISYPTNADAQKTLEQRLQDTASSVQTALNTRAKLSGADFTGNVGVSTSGTVINGSNGTSTFVSSNSGKVPVIAKGASGQTANLQEWQNSSGAVVASIDASGRNVFANIPAFNATTANGTTWSAGSTIVWNVVSYNNGGHYSSSTGRFTAPIAGYYHFDVICGGTDAFYADLWKNGNMWRRVERTGSTGWFVWLDLSTDLYLAANDYVEVRDQYGTIRVDAPYAGFSGHLVG